jgi:Uma2 family endonuclease
MQTKIDPMRVKGTATEEDLLHAPEDGNKYELVDGDLVASPTGFYASNVSGRILHVLQAYLDENPIGWVGSADAGIRLPDGNVRSPDVCVIRNERLPDGVAPRTFAACAPDLAVEVLSPSDSPRQLGDKIGEYLEYGVPLVWLVDPEAKTVTVFRSLTNIRSLKSGDTITADPVLPGFSCNIARFFG